MNIELNYTETLERFNKSQGKDFIKYLESLCDLDLYSFSTGWLSDSSYILKANGLKGDLIVEWRA